MFEVLFCYSKVKICSLIWHHNVLRAADHYDTCTKTLVPTVLSLGAGNGYAVGIYWFMMRVKSLFLRTPPPNFPQRDNPLSRAVCESEREAAP